MWGGPRAGTKDDKAHPPIHPVRALGQDAPPDLKKVYDFIARHFLGSISKDA